MHTQNYGTALTNLEKDKRVDEYMGMVLRSGVLLAAALVLVGGGVFLARHPMPVTNYGVFQGEPEELRTLRGIFHEAMTFSSAGPTLKRPTAKEPSSSGLA